MDTRFFSRAGISAKLSLLSIVVFLGIGATIFIGWKSLERISDIVRRQSVASTIAFTSYDLQQRVYVSWLSLFRLHADEKMAENDRKADASAFLSSLADTDTALATLSGLSIDAKTSDIFKDIESACANYKSDAEKASAALALGVKGGPGLFQLAAFSFSLLEARLTQLDNVTRQQSVAIADEGRAATNATTRFLAIVSLAVLLAVLAFSIAISRSITKPLGRIVAAVGAVGSGDLTVSAVDAGGGELGSIASRLDSLVIDLRGLVDTVKKRLVELEEAGATLASSMTITGEAADRIEESVADSRRRLGEQSSAVREVSSAIESLARSVEKLSGRLANQSELITESSASVEEMIANIESVAGNAQSSTEASARLVAEGGEGKAKIDEVDAAIASIVLSSESLGEAARLITEIADQTNLLAMNASIEAAHAGDAGRGFAVVAEEIRKLAEQATSRAKDISNDLDLVTRSIEAVRAASSAAVDSFASILARSGSVGESVRSIGGAMSEQREGGKLVLEALARLKDITREITQESGAMGSESRSILGIVTHLKSINEEVVSNDEDIVSRTVEISREIAGAAALSSRNAELIGEVHAAAEKFRT
jgi:methyl-accepting chemotaxis protein